MNFKQSIHQFKKILRKTEDESVFTNEEYGYLIEYTSAEYTEAHIEYAIEQLIREVSEFDLSVISLIGLRQSYWMLRKPLSLYAKLFDERIFTMKLLGKPSPGLPPPSLLAVV